MYYTATDAHELSAGDTVYVADNLQDLKEQIRKKSCPVKLEAILGEEASSRFVAKGLHWSLVYLIERKNKKKIRAFKNVEEAMKYAPKGIPGYPDNQVWVKNKNNGYRDLLAICINGEVDKRMSASFEELLDQYTFINGKPVGVEE